MPEEDLDDVLRDELSDSLREKQARVEELRAQLESLDQEAAEHEDKVKKNDADLEGLEYELERENERVAKLKLQSELRDAELEKVLTERETATKTTKTLIEGHLFKFGKRKNKPQRKYVWLTVNPNGVPMLDWADNPTSTKLNRHIIRGVYDINGQQTSIPEYSGKTFSIEVEPKSSKALEFCAEDENERRKWVQFVETALTAHYSKHGVNNPLEEMKPIYEFTFPHRPLGFGVDYATLLDGDDAKAKEQMDKNSPLVVTSIQHNELIEEGLQVGYKLLYCNGCDLTKLDHKKMMLSIKEACEAKKPVTIRFEGFLAPAETNKDKSKRETNMQDLYPEAESGSVKQHPLLDHPDLAKHLNNKDFYRLVKDLINDPKELNAFLQDPNM